MKRRTNEVRAIEFSEHSLTKPILKGTRNARKRHVRSPHRRIQAMSKLTEPKSNTVSATQYRITPAETTLNRQFSRLIISSGFSTSRVLEEVHRSVNDENLSPTIRFLCSVLIDLQAWGADFEIDQSQLLVTVQSISSAIMQTEERMRMQSALQRLRGDVGAFIPSISSEDAARGVIEGEFALGTVDSDPQYLGEIFRSGISTWSMPYRPREGRSTRLVLTVNVGGNTHGAGILEIGDDAPRNPPRDRLMGLSTELTSLTEIDLQTIRRRFEDLRSCLLPDGLPDDYRDSALKLAPTIDRVIAAGRGRTGSAQEIALRKRLTYLARLLKAELACLGIKGGSFGDGLRVIRDLSVPRTNVELTVCGALPPFGSLLVGKLVASMACHPNVRRFVDRDFGIITSGLFDVSRLDLLLPRHGSLIVTTRGLYPVHSAQYRGVMSPGLNGQMVALRKLDDTEGQTASHISDMSFRLAVAVTESMGGMETSKVFGAGGAKRQRIIAEALRKIGLPLGLGHASVSRPVYGVSLVQNLERVILFNESPIWLAEPYNCMSSDEDYVRHSVDWWRTRWASQISKRVSEITK